MTRVIAHIEGEDVFEHFDGRVTFTAKAAVDEDGAPGNPMHDPCWQPGTSLRHPDGSPLDALKEKYVVVPPAVRLGVRGVVLGCRAMVEYRGRVSEAVVGDVGPSRKLGEISVALARELGIPDSPTRGGVADHAVHYTLWPGTPAVVDGIVYRLQPAGA